jgi:hypothetical protein
VLYKLQEEVNFGTKKKWHYKTYDILKEVEFIRHFLWQDKKKKTFKYRWPDLISWIGAIQATGGNDCPEFSLTGIEAGTYLHIQYNLTMQPPVFKCRSTPGVLMGSVLFLFLCFYVVLLYVFTLWVPCCDVRYDFRLQTMFGSSLLPVVKYWMQFNTNSIMCLII